MSSGGRKKPVFLPNPRLTVGEARALRSSKVIMGWGDVMRVHAPNCRCPACRGIRKLRAALKRMEEEEKP